MNAENEVTLMCTCGRDSDDGGEPDMHPLGEDGCSSGPPPMPAADGAARCSRCDEVVGTVVTANGSVTIRLSTSSHGDRLPITCPRVLPPESPTQ